MRRAAHGQDGNPNLALPATDLLVPWAQSRTPSITSSVSGGSAMSVASLDSDVRCSVENCKFAVISSLVSLINTVLCFHCLYLKKK